MRIVFIVNPVSGRHGGLVREVERLVATIPVDRVRYEVFATTHAGHAVELARVAATSGADVVAAWGGDGTVNDVARGVTGTATALAVIPAGSGNGLARALGIPLAPARALEVALAGRTRTIDTGVVNGAPFVNVAGTGFDAQVAWAFNAARRGRLGLRDYARLTVRELRRYRPVEVHVSSDEQSVTAPVLLVAVANSSQYGNGARIAPDAVVDDGLLDVVVVRGSTPLIDVWRARRLFTGTIAKDAGVSTWRSRAVRIESAGPLVHHVDGEPRDAAAMLEVSVRPRSLRVVVG